MKSDDWFKDFKNESAKQESKDIDVLAEKAAEIFINWKVYNDIFYYKNLIISKMNSPGVVDVISNDSEGNIQGMYAFSVGLEDNSVHIENVHREVLTERGVGTGTRDMTQIEEIFTKIKNLNVEFSTGNGLQTDTIEWLKKKFSYVFDDVNKVMNKQY